MGEIAGLVPILSRTGVGSDIMKPVGEWTSTSLDGLSQPMSLHLPRELVKAKRA
jgi:Cu/Ag efflux pump CusA